MMASRRCLNALTRQFFTLFHSNSQSLQPLKSLSHYHFLYPQRLVLNVNQPLLQSHNFSSQYQRPHKPKYINDKKDDEEEAGNGETSEEEAEEVEGEIDGQKEEGESGNASSSVIERAYSVEEKIKEAAEIGYKVVGPLQRSDRVFKPYEPLFAVVQIGSHQFKVSNGDCIYTEKLKCCDVNDKGIVDLVVVKHFNPFCLLITLVDGNTCSVVLVELESTSGTGRNYEAFCQYDSLFLLEKCMKDDFMETIGCQLCLQNLSTKLILNKVLLLGSSNQTIVGRPIVPDAAVHAVVEEHALDAKVIIFKKKRRKNYRRTKGHRQELTRLRITDIQGIEKPEKPSDRKTEKPSSKVEKVAVAI